MSEVVPLIPGARTKEYPPADVAFPFQTLQELSALPTARDWIAKNITAKGETSAWIGAPGSLKSALRAEATVHHAAARDWRGHKIKRPHGVLYFALERADLVRRRLLAQCAGMGISGDEFGQLKISVCGSNIDLMNPVSVTRVLATIDALAQRWGCQPDVLEFDTFSRLIANGGGDENTAKDQGRVFGHIAEIKDKSGFPHVALVGHTGKDPKKGWRGSNYNVGDVDVLVAIDGDGDTKTATIIKRNDGPEGPLFSFKSAIHDFGADEDGDPITVNFINPEELQASKKPGGWSKGLKFVRECIDAGLIESGVNYQIAEGPTVRAVNVQTVRAIHQKRYVSNGEGDRNEAEKKAWQRNFRSARELNLIGGEPSGGKEWIWIIA
jgi:AAA domain